MPNKDNPNRIKNEELRDQGMSEEKAARIANSWKEASKKGGKHEKYKKWSVEELYQKAEEVGIEDRSDMDKEEMIQALKNH